MWCGLTVRSYWVIGDGPASGEPERWVLCKSAVRWCGIHRKKQRTKA